MALLEQQLEEASDEKINRRRQLLMHSAETDGTRFIAGLDSGMERVDVLAELVHKE